MRLNNQWPGWSHPQGRSQSEKTAHASGPPFYNPNPNQPMTADNITEHLVETISWEIAEIHAELHQLQEGIRDSEITPDKAAETLADIVATIARLGEIYANQTNSKP